MAEPEENEDEGGQVRSPQYPQLSLEQAVQKAKAIYDKDKTAGTPMQAVWPIIGYSTKSGPAATALAALKRFGLVEVRSARVFPTKRAITIACLPESDQRRKDALKEAALSPSLYKQLLEQYADSGLPSPDSLKQELMLGERFNHNAIPGLVKDFFSSLKYAGLTDEKGVLLATGTKDAEENDGAVDDIPADEKKGEKSKLRNMVTGTKEDVYALDVGALVVQWPERIRGATPDDIDTWLKLVSGKLKRAVDDGKSESEEASK